MLPLDSLFGVHERALLLRGERTAVLAANLANADTPGYKARDINFASVLAGEQANLPMAAPNSGQAVGTAAGSELGGSNLQYRVPYQASTDGNTVEAQVEQAAFAENTVRYQASLMFITRQVQALEAALASP
ncbi:MAG: hypothetical protein RJB26_2199 [Pseudomonadota bacterium]|jgi:flagellar basal-body rod protein FlgB